MARERRAENAASQRRQKLTDMATRHGTPGATRSWKRQERSLPWSLWRENSPTTDHSILDF